MRCFQLFSDLHLELTPHWPRIEPRADLLILAGDIATYDSPTFLPFFAYCAAHWRDVVYVPGNHEYYTRRSMATTLHHMRAQLAAFPNVHLLVGSAWSSDAWGCAPCNPAAPNTNNTPAAPNTNNAPDATICTTTIHSATTPALVVYGWTAWTPPSFATTEAAKFELSDYRRKLFTLEEHAALSDAGVRAFRRFLADWRGDSDTVLCVVSHFPPRRFMEVGNSAADDPIDAYFAWADNSFEVPRGTIWCSGHTHCSHDVTIDGVRYVSNQVGYEDEGVPHDRAGLVVVV